MNERNTLRKDLEDYLDKGLYPLHMPGHKRADSVASCHLHMPGYVKDSSPASEGESPSGQARETDPFAGMRDHDLTEIKGTDDLHRAKGMLRRAMDRTAALYGASRTFYLVNGSTVGILAAVSALCKRRDTVIAARNCHISVSHAIEVNDLSVKWVLPGYDPDFDIYTRTETCAVRDAITETIEKTGKKPACVVITSPTYEGVLSDIKKISEICLDFKIPLIVDEAHGAHLRFAGGYEDALSSGADLVVQSPHKTLCSFTQTAWMHISDKALKLIPDLPERIEEKLSVYETSSPSYPLMMSLDECTEIMADRGEELSGTREP